uniref:Uncharacterized protein n=1 Tax=Anguilla anguilla TaxID=7936 RepID=A0A0E9V272_ANGAN
MGSLWDHTLEFEPHPIESVVL